MVATSGVHAPKQIYVIGGYSQHGIGDYEATNKVYCYNPATDTWSQAADMPTARYNMGVAVLNDRIYVMGGGLTTTSKDGWDIPTTDVVEVFTPLGYGAISPSSSPNTTQQVLTGDMAVIAGIIVAVTVIAVASLVVFHFKHVPVKASKAV
jgi:hypothetical protein